MNFRTLALSAALVMSAACGNNVENVRKSSPVPVRAVSVTSSATGVGYSYVGTVGASKSNVVLSMHGGKLEKLYVKPGDRISEGQVVALIRSETLVSAHEASKAALEQAEDAMARMEKVYASGSVSEIQMMDVKTKLEQARASESAAANALEECRVKAPFDGTVGDVYAHEGELLSAASALLRILDAANVEIHFSVPENEYSKIRLGDRANVEVPALGRSLSGLVSVKGVEASKVSHSYDFTLDRLSSSCGLVPGMVCKISFDTSAGSGIVIPSSSVMTDVNGRYVWTVDAEDSVCKTRISVGSYSGKGVVVSSGLEEGDRIIVDGSRKVSSGMKVKVLD